MRTSVWKWASFAVLLTGFSLSGLAGISLYAYTRDSGPAMHVPVSCPSPAASLQERKEKEDMVSRAHQAALPVIDKNVPTQTETATFGLG